MKKLMKNFKIIDFEINIKFKAIVRVINAKMRKQNKKFANIYFAKITTFVKNNISLIKQIFFLSDFVEHLYKTLYKIYDIYYEAFNV